MKQSHSFDPTAAAIHQVACTGCQAQWPQRLFFNISIGFVAWSGSVGMEGRGYDLELLAGAEEAM